MLLNFILLLIVNYIEASLNEPCLTAVNETAICIKLSDCYTLNEFLRERSGIKILNAQRKYITNSQCGVLDNEILICCAPQYRNAPIQKISSDLFKNPRSAEQNGSPQANLNQILLPQPTECGIAKMTVGTRIMGGEPTKIDQYPWLALLKYTPDTNSQARCGGSLINNRHVLTAGHCVESLPNNLQVNAVRLGDWDLGSEIDCADDSDNIYVCAPKPLDMHVAQIIVHPDYVNSARDRYNDIALLRLEEAVTYTKFIQPICLPLDEALRNQPFDRQEMTAVGWGITESGRYSDKKMEVTLLVRNNSICKRVYSEQEIIITDKHICAGREQGVDSCGGDSGGPLMHKTVLNDVVTYTLAGVISFGPKECGQYNYPSVNTRVGAYIDWIQNNLKH